MKKQRVELRADRGMYIYSRTEAELGFTQCPCNYVFVGREAGKLHRWIGKLLWIIVGVWKLSVCLQSDLYKRAAHVCLFDEVMGIEKCRATVLNLW